MKFKFRLEKVLQHRKTIENLAQKDFQDAVFVLTQEQQKLQKMYLEKTEARERAFDLAQAGGNQGMALGQVADFMKGQDLRIEKQVQRIKKAEVIVEEKREILRQAVIEYKIVDKLKEKKFEDFKEEVMKLEQKEIDEQVTMRFKRGNS